MSLTVLELIDLLESMPDDATLVVPGEKGSHYGIIAAVYDSELDAVVLSPE